MPGDALFSPGSVNMSVCCYCWMTGKKKISKSLLTPAERVYYSRPLHKDICYFKFLCRQILKNNLIHILYLGLMLVSPTDLPLLDFYFGNELRGKPG